jgi:hypothetical protein
MIIEVLKIYYSLSGEKLGIISSRISWSNVLSGMITGHSSEGKPGHAKDAFTDLV